jgi:hypothetical protein
MDVNPRNLKYFDITYDWNFHQFIMYYLGFAHQVHNKLEEQSHIHSNVSERALPIYYALDEQNLSSTSVLACERLLRD